MKEGQEKSLAIPENLQAVPANSKGKSMAVLAKCQGNDLIVKGDLSSSDSTKSLNVIEGKEKIVGEDSSCYTGYLAAGGRDFLIQQLEALHVELINYLGQLKICKCCPQHYRQGDAWPRMLEITKEAQVLSVDLDKGQDEIPWPIKEKKRSKMERACCYGPTIRGLQVGLGSGLWALGRFRTRTGTKGDCLGCQRVWVKHRVIRRTLLNRWYLLPGCVPRRT
jgi:hypothetical protein